jgi:hypothetical protein
VATHAKRIVAAGFTTLLITLAGAGTALADPGNSQGKGPAGCFGPPGQTIVAFERMIGPPGQVSPPGQQVSACAQQGGGGAVS